MFLKQLGSSHLVEVLDIAEQRDLRPCFVGFRLADDELPAIRDRQRCRCRRFVLSQRALPTTPTGAATADHRMSEQRPGAAAD